MAAIWARNPLVGIEVLTDWGGHREEAAAIRPSANGCKPCDAQPACFNHNPETVERRRARCAVVPAGLTPWAYWLPQGS